MPCLMICSSNKIFYTGWLSKRIMRMNVGTMAAFCFLQPFVPHGCKWNANFRCNFDFFLFFFSLIAFNQLGWCFVRWQWRELPHAVQVFEEVTWGWGRSNDNIGLHSSGDSSCVDICQNGNAAESPLSVCVSVHACVYSWWKCFKSRARGMRPEADRSSATWKRKQNGNCKSKRAARRCDSWWGKAC